MRRDPVHTLIDAHVHLQPMFDIERFLDAAAGHMQAAAGAQRLPGRIEGCLVLADDAAFSQFRRLRDARDAGAWCIEPTGEATSLRARREGDGAVALTIVAGRQVVTAERLEVLALNTRAVLADDQPFEDALAQVVDVTGQAVVPWGFGKWLGRRGRLIHEAIETGGEGVWLGDSAARPTWSPRSKLFKRARDRGLPVLPGSDPLPLLEEVDWAGAYGFVLAGALAEAAPGATLASRLHAMSEQPRVYGRRKSVVATVRCQSRLRVRSS